MRKCRISLFACFIFTLVPAVPPAAASAASGAPRVLAFYETGFSMPEVSGEWRGWSEFARNPAAADGSLEEGARPAVLYDSHAPATIERHLAEASDAGIDTLIAHWEQKADFHDIALTRCLFLAEKQQSPVRFAAHYTRLEPATIQQAVADLRHIAGNHGRSTHYLRIDERPVIFLKDSALAALPPEDWERVREYVNEKFPAVFLADAAAGERSAGFGGLYQSNAPDLAAQGFSLARIFGNVANRVEVEGGIGCAVVTPGFKPAASLPRRDGETYRGQWQAALEAGADWIIIDSFNDWTRGSQVEPRSETQREYLEQTRMLIADSKEIAEPTSAPPMVFINATVSLGEVNDTTRLQQVEWQHGRTVPGSVHGYTGRKLALEGDNRYLYFDIDDGFDLTRGARVFVSYVDLAPGEMQIEYDSRDGFAKPSVRCPLEGDEHLREFMFYLPDARFAGRQPGMNDFRILFPSGEAMITGVRVSAPLPPKPPDRPTPAKPVVEGQGGLPVPFGGEPVDVQYKAP